MATYAETYDRWGSATLRKQVTIAVLYAARTVFTEPVGTANHANRLKWAQAVMADPGLMAVKLSVGVITTPSMQVASPADADVQTVIDNLVNVFANNMP